TAMFYGAKAFNSDIFRWDTANVVNMEGMFFDASSFNHDISGWNVDRVNHSDKFATGANVNFTTDKQPIFK
ncbi:BspA family leucine-rich repeat surface protein, partial [Aliivibrio fischeri]